MDITESMLEEATENLHCAMQDLLNNEDEESYDEAVKWNRECGRLIEWMASDAS